MNAANKARCNRWWLLSFTIFSKTNKYNHLMTVHIRKFIGSLFIGWQQEKWSNKKSWTWIGSGVSHSNDGSMLAIGKPGCASGTRSNVGCVCVFQNQISEWVQIGSDIEGRALSNRAGTAVALSADGTSVALGSEEYAFEGSSDTGYIGVYLLFH